MARTRKLDIGVAGAGIAGLATALALRKAGFESTVFERATSTRMTGGALILWSSALRALARLGLASDVISAGTVFRAYEFRTFRGDLVATLPVADFAKRDGNPCLLIRRSALLSTLERALGATRIVQYGKKLERITSTARRVDVSFADGSKQGFDLLIGADGIHSRVRELVQGDRPLRSGHRTAWLGLVRLAHPLIQAGVAMTTLGPGTGIFIAGLEPGTAYWYVTVPEGTAIRRRDDLVKYVRGAHEPIVDLIAGTPDDAIVVTPIRDRAPARPWTAGRMVLLGDSAHPSAPDLGQGACQAIESAACLAEYLSTRSSSVEAVLRRYEESRFARCALITALSRGALLQDVLDDPIAGSAWAPALKWTLPLSGPKVFESLFADA